jgi:hypothetical protein
MGVFRADLCLLISGCDDQRLVGGRRLAQGEPGDKEFWVGGFMVGSSVSDDGSSSKMCARATPKLQSRASMSLFR